MLKSNNRFEACILVNGKPIKEIDHNGSTYVEGRSKSSYELFFKNNTCDRVLFVPSVDGLCTVDGNAAGHESSGYIIEAWQHVTIPGWTVDNESAAKFVFKAQNNDETYVEQMGQDVENQGVIGFMVFEEKRKRQMLHGNAFKPSRSVPWNNPPYLTPAPIWTMGSASTGGEAIGSVTPTNSTAGQEKMLDNVGSVACYNASVMDSNIIEESLGTGFGKETEFNTVVDNSFTRKKNYSEIFVFYYDTLKNLKKMGIPIRKFTNTEYSSKPNAFPNSAEVGCRVPEKWKGKTARKSYTGAR